MPIHFPWPHEAPSVLVFYMTIVFIVALQLWHHGIQEPIQEGM